MKKGVIILSGGMDSATLLYDLRSQGVQLYAISFNYGQKHSKELLQAAELCKRVNVPHQIVSLSNIQGLLKSCLTTSQEVPEGLYDQDNMKATVVPNRNMIMLSIATGYAISNEADVVYFGAHAGDHSIYPDCRVEFREALSKAMQLCHFYPLRLEAPYNEISKSEVARKGLALNVPYELTWSCYKGQLSPCGKCGTCTERVEAFLDNKVKDPLMTEVEWKEAVEFYKTLKNK
jgi:7-cyano-7-deazaguanine synthase